MSKPVVRVSPSQIEDYAFGCARKWGLVTIDKLHKPQHPSAAKGDRIHAINEAWLKDGTPAPKNEDGSIWMPALRHLPPPGVADVESKFEFTVEYEDYIIVYNGRRDGRWNLDGRRTVFDLKSTGNLQWAEDAESLPTDTQGVLYGKSEMVEDPELLELELFWLYVLTKGKRRAVPVKVLVTREHIEQEFTRIELIAREMVEIRLAGKRGLDLPPNAEHCSAFGGCPFVDVCKLTPQERMRSIMAQESLKERMARKLAEKQAAAAAGSAPAAKNEVVEDAEVVETGTCSCGAEAEVGEGGKLVAHTKPGGGKCGGKAPLPAGASINPPEAPAVKTSAPKTKAAPKVVETQMHTRAGSTPVTVEIHTGGAVPPAALSALSAEDAKVFVLIEALDPQLVQRARVAVQRLA